nr:MAG TPA: hypothetical protein [Caudoviricetes sp.]
MQCSVLGLQPIRLSCARYADINPHTRPRKYANNRRYFALNVNRCLSFTDNMRPAEYNRLRAVFYCHHKGHFRVAFLMVITMGITAGITECLR